MWTEHIFVIGAASELRVWFRASKTGLQLSSYLTGRSSVAVLCLCVCGFKCDVCFVLICSSSHLLLVYREGCAL